MLEVNAHLAEHLGGEALAFSYEGQENVFGADVTVVEVEGLPEGQLQDGLGPGREWGRALGRVGGGSAFLSEPLPHRLALDTQAGQGFGSTPSFGAMIPSSRCSVPIQV